MNNLYPLSKTGGLPLFDESCSPYSKEVNCQVKSFKSTHLLLACIYINPSGTDLTQKIYPIFLLGN